MQRMLVADDDAAIRSILRDFLEDEGYDVDETESGAGVLAALASNDGKAPDLVLMDIRMPDKGGLEVLRELAAGKKQGVGQLPIIIMTAFGTSSTAIEAMQLGAYDYITKPFNLDEVLVTIQRFFDRQALSEQVQQLSTRLGERDPNEIIIGNSAAMQEVYKTIGRVARSDATVLITGETGTGKELVATVLHRTSSYRGGPLVKVNCAALPETLLESELFGHEKGAFTGALNQRKGRFEMAHKGTIFLDEVGEMTLSTQKKLLRVLQEREFERVGGSVSVKIDTRVISATNKILTQEIENARFREDLYYRLNVIAIYLPPLRDRIEDIPLLVEHFLRKFNDRLGKRVRRVSAEAMAALMSHRWPGNIRELENLMERSVLLAESEELGARDLPGLGADPFGESAPEEEDFDELGLKDYVRVYTARLERARIQRALEQEDGNVTRASRRLGISRKSLQTKMKEYGLRDPPDRT